MLDFPLCPLHTHVHCTSISFLSLSLSVSRLAVKKSDTTLSLSLSSSCIAWHARIHIYIPSLVSVSGILYDVLCLFY